MRKMTRKEYFKTTLVTLAVLCFFCFFVYQRVWAPAEERRYAPGTVTGNFAIQGITTLGDGTEDYVTFNADYVEFLNPTIFDLAFGATFDGSGIPLVFKATQFDLQLTGMVIGPDGSISAPGFAFNDGGGVYDTGWWNSASKGNCLMHASVDATEVMNIDVATTTVKNNLDVDGSAVLGKGTTGNSLLFRGMDSWTSQAGPSAFTWNIDLPTTFAADGQTVTMNATLWDFTGSDVKVSDATTDTEALNWKVGDARYKLSTETEEVFFETSDSGTIGDYSSDAVGSKASTEIRFAVPADFGTLVSLGVLIISEVTNATADIDFDSDYGAVGESYNNHSESDTTSTYNLVANQKHEIDISSVFSALAAGDSCGMTWQNQTIGGTTHLLHVRLRYTRP